MRAGTRTINSWACWLALGAALPFVVAGCGGDGNSLGRLDKIWGRRGLSEGRFQKPRAVAIDAQDRLYIVDMTARIQVFDTEGQFLRAWRTPAHSEGRPTGLTIDRDGTVIVADTHYYQVLIYSAKGKLLHKIGGTKGHGPGEFGWVTHCVRDSQGNFYISEYGEYDRIQKLNPRYEFVREWGGHGSDPGQFIRPQKMAVDAQDRIWVTDACNHRIQVFNTEGKLLKYWGQAGSEPGQLYYPYDLKFDDQGNLLVCEYGNHRVQKFDQDGNSLGCWGTVGRGPGQLYNPWGLVRDSQGRVYVLDSNNHRVQRITL